MTRTDYEKLVGLFTAEKFDADAFVDVAKSASADYIVSTSKHHDGFCMWDTASNKKTLHVWGIPADAVANECAVVRLDFPSGRN